MQRGFEIDIRHSIGNIHIQLKGEFNGICAWELIKTIRKKNTGSGRIFINTIGIERIIPESVTFFKSHLHKKKMAPDWLYFKGEKGFLLAPNGSRVIICNKNKTPKKIFLKPIQKNTHHIRRDQ